MLKKIMLIMCFMCAFSVLSAVENFYDESENYSQMRVYERDLMVHKGNNVWMIFNDTISYHEMNYTINNARLITRQYWFCPYCHHRWPHGSPCTNPECPSRY